MNSNNLVKIFTAAAALLLIISCGVPAVDTSVISGAVTVPAEVSSQAKGPLFVAVSKTDSLDAIESDPANNIAVMTAVDSAGNYSIDIKDTGLAAGDEVFLFAFADNDFSGGVPGPTAGDLVGFYIDTESLNTKYKIGGIKPPDITVNRLQYDFSSEVIGLIDSSEAGDLILIAYAGDFSSTDFSSIDVNSIVGYTKTKKGVYPATFSLKIMPYGFNAPISGVYVIALLDKNSNGIPDDGDMIGFASESAESSFPVAITVTEGVVSAGTIQFKIPVYTEPDDGQPPLRIIGEFDKPAGYSSDPAAKPVFIIAAKGSDPNTVFENIKNINTDEFVFKKIDQGENTFDIELPRRNFKAGDEIFILALWDKDFDSGMPNATAGDKIGFVQNKNAFSYTVTLQEFDNTLVNTGSGYTFNGAAGYEFKINRKFYNQDAALKFKFDRGDLSDSEFANGKKIICLAVYETGIVSTGYVIDMDKILATSTVTLQRNGTESIYYTIPVMPALLESIPAESGGEFSVSNVWVMALLDSNGNGKPDTGEKIGYYWKTYLLFWTAPEVLPNPVMDGTMILDKNVYMSDNTY